MFSSLVIIDDVINSLASVSYCLLEDTSNMSLAIQELYLSLWLKTQDVISSAWRVLKSERAFVTMCLDVVREPSRSFYILPGFIDSICKDDILGSLKFETACAFDSNQNDLNKESEKIGLDDIAALLQYMKTIFLPSTAMMSACGTNISNSFNNLHISV